MKLLRKKINTFRLFAMSNSVLDRRIKLTQNYVKQSSWLYWYNTSESAKWLWTVIIISTYFPQWYPLRVRCMWIWATKYTLFVMLPVDPESPMKSTGLKLETRSILPNIGKFIIYRHCHTTHRVQLFYNNMWLASDSPNNTAWDR